MPETFEFNADISQLMSLIINAFYSKKDIFLRELISNASDAIEKIRYQSLTDKSCIEACPDFRIRIKIDKDNQMLVIEDTGIGMTKQHLIDNLGTLAKSGTKSFIQNLQEKGDINQIGQFGVGFYSVYLVADKVTVQTKHNDDCQYIWESCANDSQSFSIEKDESNDIIRGTRINIHLKDDQLEFLEETKIEELVETHSQFITHPIELWATRIVQKEVDDDEEKTQENEKVEDGTVEEVNEEEEEKPKKKTVSETVQEWKRLNENQPIWTIAPKDVTKEQYEQFYKSFTNAFDEPLNYKHFRVEGQIEFTGLIYLPPMDMFGFMQNKKFKNSIKLYAKRVFIMDNCEQILPEYLNFIKGLVDSEDLQLNVSREMLQQSSVLKQIKNNLVKKCIEMFTELMEDENQERFNKFYEAYGKNIKLGIYEDSKNREKLCGLLRYHHSNGEDVITLDKYIEEMKEGQDKIYYIAGETKEMLENSPFIEVLKAKGFDVLYMTDPIDEYMLQQLRDYKDKKFSCITKDKLDFGESEEEKKQREEEAKAYEDLCKYVKDTLGDKVEKVVVSTRIKDSPCILVSSEHGWSANMERIVKAQALRNKQTEFMMNSKKTMEINPNHRIFKTIAKKQDDTVKDVVNLLFETALINSGFNLDKPRDFADRIHRMIGLGICEDEVDEQVDEENVSQQVEGESVMEQVD